MMSVIRKPLQLRTVVQEKSAKISDLCTVQLLHYDNGTFTALVHVDSDLEPVIGDMYERMFLDGEDWRSWAVSILENLRAQALTAAEEEMDKAADMRIAVDTLLG
jgi:hypothetical protein